MTHEEDLLEESPGMLTLVRRAPKIPMLFLLALIMPPETSMMLGELRLSPYRFILLPFVPLLLVKLLGKKVGAIQTVDWLILFHSFWPLVTLAAVHGQPIAMQTGGIYAVESAGAYLVARCCIRRLEDFQGVVGAFVLIILLMLVFTLPEAVTGNHVLRETARAVLGGPPLPDIEKRLGLSRAFGSFEHPILYGIFCVAGFGMSIGALAGRRGLGMAGLARVSAVAVAVFASVSSGAFVAMGVQMGLMAWERLTRSIAGRWIILGTIILAILTGTGLASSRSPVKVFLSYATFSQSTGYNRLLIFDYGTAEAGRHPLFGIGLNEWERPSYMSASMDNFWLVCAVRYGILSFATLAGGMVLLVLKLGRLKDLDPVKASVRNTWSITILSISLAGCTVHFWNALFTLFFFLLGTSVWMLEPDEDAEAEESAGDNENGDSSLDENRFAF